MSSSDTLIARSGNKCELCGSEHSLTGFEVPGNVSINVDILLCAVCHGQLSNPVTLDESHWHCLKDSMWNPEAAVQVMAWRLLTKYKQAAWASDLLDVLYIDDEKLEWAQSDPAFFDDLVATKDSNGALLAGGDTVTIIKDLDVKGTGFTAKRGTAVRNISLCANPEHIEGKVNGTRIVLLTCYVKKS
ncbi:PhnA domain-containing protein [Teredinibacter purpureus]|uniref:PhnA domain-containing protein n=1 Tax=Teredinibacter purpureus TaxID=2731756 RepID=UPI0005F79CA2|nr:alkylphosphonate utilization protein [Teredinibacter purpureus]